MLTVFPACLFPVRGVKDCSRRERSCELAAEVQRAFRPQTMRFIRSVLPGTQELNKDLNGVRDSNRVGEFVKVMGPDMRSGPGQVLKAPLTPSYAKEPCRGA